jgi:peptidoglycan/xylan/chitin deacetylase (PgdA/CDA1 family)
MEHLQSITDGCEMITFKPFVDHNSTGLNCGHAMQNQILRPAIPILMYHQISPGPSPAFRKYAVTVKAFAAQMQWLTRAGYIPISLDALIAYRSGLGTLPLRPVVITFDDGFRDCAEHAVPILKAQSFTATFYLVAGLVGKTSRWLLSERGIEFPLIDWATARQLVAAGFDCGCHTMSHPRLADLTPALCRDELIGARQLLEDNLGHGVTHLAYPFGSFNDSVRAIAAETGYRSACSVQVGLSRADDDPLALHRVPICGQDSLLDFICRLRTARSVREYMGLKARALMPVFHSKNFN